MTIKLSLQPCPEDECADGQCIYAHQRCNGVRDCAGGEDETGCRKYQITVFNRNTFPQTFMSWILNKHHLKSTNFHPFYLTNLFHKNLSRSLTKFILFYLIWKWKSFVVSRNSNYPKKPTRTKLKIKLYLIDCARFGEIIFRCLQWNRIHMFRWKLYRLEFEMRQLLRL